MGAIDHIEQRAIAAAALQSIDIAPPRAIAAARRLTNPRPLTDLELGYLDAMARRARDSVTRDLAGGHWHAYTSAAVTKQRTRDVSRKLARVDQVLGDQLYSAAVTAMREALRHAGVKAIVRARSKAMRAAIDAEGLTDEVLHAIRVDADELLDRAFEAYGITAREWMRLSAVKRRSLIAQMYDLSEGELTDPGAERRIKASSVILVGVLLGIARRALTNVHPGEDLEIDVPFGAVRVAMKVEQGGEAQPSNSALGVEVRRPQRTVTEELLSKAVDLSRPTPDLDALASGDAINVPSFLGGDEPTLVARYEWIHGFWGEPPTVFGPHLALDRLEYTDESRGTLLAADPNEWPHVQIYEAGDHDGCTCNEVVTWEPVGNQVLINKLGGPF